MSGVRGTVVVVSSVHWHFTWQRHHELASRLARHGFAVAFVEPIPKRWPGVRESRRALARITGRRESAGGVPQPESPGVVITSPLALPDTNTLSRAVNRRLVRRLAATISAGSARRPLIVIHYLPLAAAIALQRDLQPDLAIYDCVASWPDDHLARPSTLREEDLISAVDIVLADGPTQVTRMRDRAQCLVELPPAVDYERWAPVRDAPPPRRQPPVAAYFGTIGHDIDVELLERLSWSGPLRLIGPVQVPLRRLCPGTEQLGTVPHTEIHDVLADVDVIVLPYRTDGHARGVIPAKTFECLATGRPVVATALPTLEQHRDVFTVCDTQEAFLDAVRCAADGDTPAYRRRRLSVARSNDWEVRIRQLVNTINEGLRAVTGQ